MLQHNYIQIMYSKNAELGMSNEYRGNEEMGVGEVIFFEQLSSMLSVPGRKAGDAGGL